MRRRLVFVSLCFLSSLLVVSMVFGLGIVNFSKFSFGSFLGVGPTQGGTSVSVVPNTIIKDYLNDPGYRIGDKFTVNVDVSDAVDLFTWQVNLTWNPTVLNFSRVKEYGSFLRATDSPNGTSGWINRNPLNNVTIVSFDYTKGYATIAETILDSRIVAPGVSGSGGLVTIEFKVLGYGCSNITISSVGNLATKLLDSTGASISFSAVDGYFKNKLFGDANGDKFVNSLDIGKLNSHWSPSGGAPPWSLGYSRDVDCNDDGYINSLDVGVVNANWGRSTP